MLVRNKWLRGLSVAAIAAIALTACEDTVVNVPEQPEPPAPPLTITITPAQLNLAQGQTSQVVATVSGGAAGTSRSVTFESSNENVASVNPTTGVVRGENAGSASIIATAVADASVRAAAGVTVTDTVPPTIPPTDGEAAVTIRSVTVGNTFTPINPDNVIGQVDVTLSVDRGSANRLEVVLNDIVVTGCTQTFGSATEPAAITAADLKVAANTVDVICSINTHAYTVDGGVGIPTFPNATYNLQARLVRNETTLATAERGPFEFNNANVIETRWEVARSATSAGGLLWHGGPAPEGNLTVHGIPVNYDQIATNTIRFAYAGSVQTALEAPFTVIFPASAAPGAPGHGILGVTDPTANANIGVTSVRDDGNPGPATNLVNRHPGIPGPGGVPPVPNPVLRLDVGSPVGGAYVLTNQNTTPAAGVTPTLCCSNNWVGANYTFSNGKTGHGDAGVGLGPITFHVGAASATNAAIAGTDPVTSGSDLSETAVNTGLRSVSVVRDLLGNSTTVPLAVSAANPQAVAAGATLGVDLTAPTISFAPGSVGHQSIFNIASGPPATNFAVNIQDQSTVAGAAPSGFGTNPVLARVDRWFPGLTAAARCLGPGVFHMNTGCRMTGTITTTAVPTSDGYHTYDAFVVDQAGNESEPVQVSVSRMVLNDQTAPSASNIAIPANLTGGAQTPFSATVTDNLNLWRVDTRLRFGGADRFAQGPMAQINDRWPESLVTSTTHAEDITFYRALEMTTAGNAPSGVLMAASHISMRVEDAAANSFFRENAFAAGTVPAGASFNTRGVNTYRISAPAAGTAINNGRTGQGAPVCAAGTPSQRGVTVVTTGASGTFQNPFGLGVTLHRYDGAGVPQLVGPFAAPTVTDDGATRTWTFQRIFDATGLPAGPVNITALGGAAAGDLLQSQNITLNVCNQS